MKLQQLSTCLGLIATSAIALSVEPARAFDFSGAGTNLGACGVLVDQLPAPGLDPDLLTSCTTADGFTLTASSSVLGTANLQGKLVDQDLVYKSVGITTTGGYDAVLGELQGGEVLDVTLDVASIIKSLTLGTLYLPPVYGDQVFEKAVVMANGNLTGELTVTSANSAVWSLGGVVTNLDLSQEGDGGVYKIANPFGDIAISSLQFTSLGEFGLYSSAGSDYTLIAIEKSDVPEPATLLGLGVVGGLMAAVRRNKKSV